MNLNIDSFKKGVAWWRKKGNWPQDFHNTVYYKIYELREEGLSENWWDDTVDRLWEWRAIRSKTPPNTKKDIKERGLKVLDILKKHYDRIAKKADKEPIFFDYTWNELAHLPQL